MRRRVREGERQDLRGQAHIHPVYALGLDLAGLGVAALDEVADPHLLNRLGGAAVGHLHRRPRHEAVGAARHPRQGLCRLGGRRQELHARGRRHHPGEGRLPVVLALTHRRQGVAQAAPRHVIGQGQCGRHAHDAAGDHVDRALGLADAELSGLVGIRAEGPAVEGVQQLVEGVERIRPAAGHADGGERVVVDGPRRGQGGEQARRPVDGLDVGVAAALALEADRVQVGDVVAAGGGVDVGVKQALAVVEGRAGRNLK